MHCWHSLSGAKVEVFADEDKTFKGLIFKDKQMLEAFHAYPELVCFDATYKQGRSKHTGRSGFGLTTFSSKPHPLQWSCPLRMCSSAITETERARRW